MQIKNIAIVTVAIGGLLAAGTALAQQTQGRGEPQRQETTAERDARVAEEAERAKAREQRQRERRERAARGEAQTEAEEDPRNIPAR